MDSRLLEILACPVCKGELLYDRQKQDLLCKFDKLAFHIVDGIPVMLESKARKLEEAELGS